MEVCAQPKQCAQRAISISMITMDEALCSAFVEEKIIIKGQTDQFIYEASKQNTPLVAFKLRLL